MNKKGIGMVLVAMMVALISGIVLFAVLKSTADAAQTSAALNIAPCKAVMCLGKEVEEQSKGILGLDSGELCAPKNFVMPSQTRYEDIDGIKFEVGKLIWLSWEMTCNGPSDTTWGKYKTLFGKEACFDTFYFRIEKFRKYSDGDVLFNAGDLDWYLDTNYYANKKDPDTGEIRPYTIREYVQDYGTTSGKIVIDVEEFKVGGIYGIAVVKQSGALKELFSLDGGNIPYVVIAENTLLERYCTI